MWMRDKRKYPEHLIGDELKKLNKYLNGAITSARSALCPKKKKLLNIDKMQSHSKQSNITLSTINQENKTMNNGSKEDLHCDTKNEKLKLKDLETDFMEKTDIDTDLSTVESEDESTRSIKTN